VIGTHQITVGLLDQCVVHPREVFRPAIKDAAKSIILVHNHPSGDPTPSDKDLQLTRRLEEVGQTLGIQVLDHIIVARTGIVSIHECPRPSASSRLKSGVSILLAFRFIGSNASWKLTPPHRSPQD